jgi:hypothetical protein
MVVRTGAKRHGAAHALPPSQNPLAQSRDRPRHAKARCSGPCLPLPTPKPTWAALRAATAAASCSSSAVASWEWRAEAAARACSAASRRVPLMRASVSSSVAWGLRAAGH